MALTPMMQQYLDIKEKSKDCILFFRLGDFYEMFFEDAEIASRELELVLTGRDCGLENRAPMCGIPFHASEGYISRLVEKGYKVAICEQVEDPSVAKGIVKREIIRIVTPGTVMESSLLDDTKNNYISCLSLYRTDFSMAVCDISTGEFLVTSSEGDIFKAIDEISKYNPAELLVWCDDALDRDMISRRINERFHLLLNFINEQGANNENLINKFELREDELSKAEVSAAASLYHYISETQKNSLGHIINLRRYNLQDYMVLDVATRKNLELTETLIGKSRKGSLLWVLDKTQTSMGSRLLRKWIEEPLINVSDIDKRLEAVEELIDNVYLASDLKEFLKTVYDMERLISKISCGSANARDLVSLSESIHSLPDIRSALSGSRSMLLKHIYDNFDCLEDIYMLIKESIEDSPPMQIKEGGLIKTGYSSEIDRLREAMTNGKTWIASLETQEREATGIKSLKVGFNKVFGYYIEITKSNFSNIPEGRYIRKQTLANAERYITPELKEIEELILGAEEKVINLEYDIFVNVRNKVAEEVLRVQTMAKYIAVIDTLLSFSQVSFENNYTKPSIACEGAIDIKDGRHPVVERVIQGIFVPNDTYLDCKDDVISIITGPNMAGKSTYMRQVALITLLAQIGCFVPARTANISIVDRIFTRIGASDDLSSGKSTFMVEMSEVSNILENATSKSLLILDEVGRGTSTFDGLSIAWSVVDYISKKISAKTLFATHYHELTELEGKLRGVKNYCISVKEHGDDIIFLRKIIRGGADQSYGIQVAKLAGLPEEVVATAREILKKLEESDINNSIKNGSRKDDIAVSILSDQRKIKNEQLSLFGFKDNEIITELKSIDIMNCTPMDAMNLLYNLVNKAGKL